MLERFAMGLVLAILVGGGLIWLALQRPLAWSLSIGGNITIEGDRVYANVYDAPYLVHVHGPEPALLHDTTLPQSPDVLADPPAPYRWTYPSAQINVPTLNGGASLVTLQLAPPPMPITPLTITLNGEQLTTTLPPGPRLLHLFTPSTADGSLHLHLDAPLYELPPDPRPLGVTLSTIDVQPTTWRPFVPVVLLLQLIGILLIVGIGAGLSGLTPRQAMLLMMVVAVLLAVVLALYRTPVTLFAGSALAIAGGALLVQAALYFGGRSLVEHLQGHREWALVCGLTALGFAVRLLGMRHPQANFSDLMLHVNNLTGVARGEVVFTEGLTCEAGAGQSPYPPGVYAVLLPVLALARSADAQIWVMQAGGALLDALTIALIWWAMRALGSRSRAALLGASLYTLPLPMLRSLTIGEFANIGGQALALPAVLGVAVWLHADQPTRWRGPILALLLLAALMHSGVLLSVGLWGVALFVVLLVQRRFRVAGQLALIGGVAAGLAVLLYYSVFIGDQRLAGTIPGCPPIVPLLTKLRNVGRGLLDLRGDSSPLMVALGGAGLWLAWRQHSAIRLVLAAWWLGAAASQVSLLWTGQTVRWTHFLYPALCIGGGIALAALAQGNRLTRVLVAGLLLIVLLIALITWITFIVTYRTGNFI